MLNKKTKIVATIGPASDAKETLKKMIEDGMNVVRINFSHGTHESNGKVIQTAKELSRDLNVPIGIMADLQGPRIRVGNKKEFSVEPGEVILISDREPACFKAGTAGQKELIIDSPGVGSVLKAGDRILIEDGIIELRVATRSGKTIKAKAMNKAVIKPRKGINVPDTQLRFGAVTGKDEEDLRFVLSKDIDFVALSFVSNAREIIETREKIKKLLGRGRDLPQIISKIEKKEAMMNLDEIIEAADAVMVARGDLGMDMDENKIVILQKEIIAKSLHCLKPVIVATQMLESMINSPIPTRAEVSDVSNAVIDHTDAVMLSGESANGRYPVETVATMKNIIVNTEESPFDDVAGNFLDNDVFSDYAAAVNSAHELAKSTRAKAIALFSSSGITARMMSHHRPEQMLLVATDNPKTYQQLSLVWGANAYLFGKGKKREALIDAMIKKAHLNGRLKSGDKIVVISGKSEGDKTVKLTELREV